MEGGVDQLVGQDRGEPRGHAVGAPDVDLLPEKPGARKAKERRKHAVKAGRVVDGDDDPVAGRQTQTLAEVAAGGLETAQQLPLKTPRAVPARPVLERDVVEEQEVVGTAAIEESGLGGGIPRRGRRRGRRCGRADQERREEPDTKPELHGSSLAARPADGTPAAENAQYPLPPGGGARPPGRAIVPATAATPAPVAVPSPCPPPRAPTGVGEPGRTVLREAIGSVVLLFVAIGLYTNPFQHIGALRERALQTRSWPSTEGVVLRAGVTQTAEEEGPTVVLGYVPDISFQYTVGGRVYQAETPWLDSETPYATKDYRRARLRRSQLLVDYVAEHYHPKQRVEVYYNPENPQDAILEIDPPSAFFLNYYLHLGTFFLLLAGSLVLAVRVLRGLFPKHPSAARRERSR